MKSAHVLLALLILLPAQATAIAQSIIPTTDTITNLSGNRIDISGGQRNGANLVHSFSQFGLDQNQSANFLTTPSIQNILAKVNGGGISFINGLLQVSGGNSNLFLINPSGIVFGTHARLDVPASFSASTTGPLINAGNLAVSPNHALSLVGGTVISTGSLSGGTVSIASLPGNATGVTVNLDGTIQLIGSDLQINPGDVVAKQVTAREATISSARDLKLIESRITTTENLTLQARDTVFIRDSIAQPFLAQAGGNLTIQGNAGIDILALNHLQTEAFQSGGKLSLISDGIISGDAHFASGGGVAIANRKGEGGNFVSYYDPIISSTGDITFGNYLGTSLKVETLGNINATGTIRITGPDTILATFCSSNPCSPDAGILASQPALILRAGLSTLTETSFPGNPPISLGGANFSNSGSASPSGDITVGGAISTNSPNGNLRLELQAKGAINLQSINSSGGNINLNMAGDLTTTTLNSNSNSTGNAGAITVQSGGNINAGNILASSTLSAPGNAFNGGAISLTANGSVTVGTVNAQSRILPTGNGNTANAGSISIAANNGNILAQDILAESFTSNGTRSDNGGVVTLQASGNITARSVRTLSEAQGTVGNGGSIQINSINGKVQITDAFTFSKLNSSGTTGTAGNLSIITSPAQTITIDDRISTFAKANNIPAGNAGNISLQSGTITLSGAVDGGRLDTFGRTIALGQNVTTNGPQTYSNPVVLTNNVSLLSGNAPIRFQSTVDAIAPGVQSLTINAGISPVTFNGAVGLNGALNSLTVNSAQSVNLNADVTTVNQQRYFSPIQVNGSRTLTSTSGILAFDNAVSHTAADSLTLNSSGGIYFASLVNAGNLIANTPGETRFGSLVNATSLTTDAGGTTQINRELTTTAFQTYNDTVQVQQLIGLLSSTGNGALTFNNKLLAVGGLTTTTGGNQTFVGDVDISGDLVITSNITDVRGNIIANALEVNSNQLLLNNNAIEGTTAQIYNTAIQMNGNVSFSSFDTPIIFNGAIAGPGNLSFINPTTTQVILNGDVNVSSLTSDAITTEINSNITTTNTQVYNFPVRISGATVNLTSDKISFNSSVDAQVGGVNSLNVTANQLTVAGKMGGVIPLKDVSIAVQQPLNLVESIDTLEGNVQASASQITTQTITTRGGNITLNSQSTVDAGSLDSSALRGDGGDIFIQTPNALIASDLTSQSVTNTGGKITLISDTGAVTAGNLNASGPIGGAIAIQARDRITTNSINSSGTLGNGGSVLLDPDNDIVVGFINAQGGTNGIGGAIEITTRRFFRALSTFSDNVSLSNVGALGGNSITLRHHGGFVGTPFEIGNAGVNGTAGEITTGTNKLNLGESFPYDFMRGNIHLVTAPEILPQPPANAPTQPNAPNQPAPIDFPDIPQATQLLTLQSEPIGSVSLDSGVERIEAKFTGAYRDYYGLASQPILKAQEIRSLTVEIEKNTGVKPAFIYVNFLAEQPNQPKEKEVLEIIVVTRRGESVRKVLYGVDRATVIRTANALITNVTDFTSDDYYEPAQKLYNWLIRSIEPELKARQIDNLLFVMDEGLRSLPIAALHDGKQFLVEQYSLGMTPSLTLTDTRYVNIKSVDLLAMGASKFKALPSLPAVPAEVATVTSILQKGKTFLNEEFTIRNLMNQRDFRSFGILHLATHGEFKPGRPDQSFIQFWDTKLRLHQIRDLRLNDPTLELLILSACRTALGDQEAELGFGGLAAQAGAKSAIASLWSISDMGTLALMTELYRALGTPSVRIKAEALQKAQIALLSGKISIQSGQLLSPNTQVPLSLPKELADFENTSLSHPYYWSSFTLIGNPW